MEVFRIIDAADQQFGTIINGRRVTIRLRYNPTSERWSFDLAIDDQPVLLGRRVVIGVDLLAPFGFGLGKIVALAAKAGQIADRAALPAGTVRIYHMSDQGYAALVEANRIAALAQIETAPPLPVPPVPVPVPPPLFGAGLRAGAVLGDEPAGFAVDFQDGIYLVRGGLGQRSGGIDEYFLRASTATYWGADGLLKTAAAHEPRIEYDPVTHEWLGLLGEGVGTNLLWHSEALDNPYWTKTAATVAADAMTAPDGTMTMDKLVQDTATSLHLSSSPNMGVAKNVSYTYSAFLKAAGTSRVRMQVNAYSGNLVYADFDLSAGTVIASSAAGGASSVSAAIQSCGNGVYRCSVSGVPSAADASNGIQASIVHMNALGQTNFAGDGVSALGIWGEQLEAGGYASSYIPTAAAAATRSADLITVPAAGWLDSDEGTLFAEWRPISNYAPTSGIVALGDPLSDGNTLNIARSVGGGLGFYAGIANVNQLSGSFFGGIASPAGVVKRGALAYRVDDYAWALAGVPGTDTSAGVPPVSELRIGRRDVSATYANSHLRRVAYFPRRLSDAELVSLTS